MTSVEDITATVKTKAIAWLARHHDVTLGQAACYLMFIRREHIAVVIDAWRAHGASKELVQLLFDKYAPKQEATTP